MSVAQSFGICVPASIAARMIEVPSGTVMLLPSIVSVTVSADVERGVPKSISSTRDMAFPLLRGLKPHRRGAEIFPEMFQRAHDGVGGEAAERAERTEFHGVAEVFDHGSVVADPFAANDLVERLDAAGRSDPARRALAAGLDGAELHRKTRLFGHVDAVVEHDHAAMADQPVAARERFIVERRIEQFARKIGAKRTTDLHRAHRAARERAAADVIDEFAECDAEG